MSISRFLLSAIWKRFVQWKVDLELKSKDCKLYFLKQLAEFSTMQYVTAFFMNDFYAKKNTEPVSCLTK